MSRRVPSIQDSAEQSRRYVRLDRMALKSEENAACPGRPDFRSRNSVSSQESAGWTGGTGQSGLHRVARSLPGNARYRAHEVVEWSGGTGFELSMTVGRLPSHLPVWIYSPCHIGSVALSDPFPGQAIRFGMILAVCLHYWH